MPHSEASDLNIDEDISLGNEIYQQLRRLCATVQSIQEQLDELGSSDGEEMLLTREEAADRLRVSTRTLDDLEASGRLQATRIGRRVLYHADALDAFIRKQSR